MKPLLTQVFGEFFTQELAQSLQGTLLECVEADRKKHKVCLHLRSSAPIAGKLAAQLRAAVSAFFVDYTEISVRSFFY